MPTAIVNSGDQVLFVAPSSSDQTHLMNAKSSFQNQVGSEGAVAFEAMERVSEAPLQSGTYNSIHSNLVFPSVSSHTAQALSQYLKALKPGGQIYLSEPVVIGDLSNTSCPITRKESDIISMLKLAGFVDVTVESSAPVSDEALHEFFKAWGVAKRVDQAVSRLSGKFGTVTIVAKKPAYEVGKKFALNFKKTPAKAEDKKKVWTIAMSDDADAELEDEDLLLDEEDKVKPNKETLTRPDDCELTDGRRKACKNCTCGRADMMDEEDSTNVVTLDMMDEAEDDEIVEVDPTPKKVGGCGSCALGDAFRCSTCPYLGMPAFQEGERVTISSGMFASDDIDI
ncbi:hypothetical protein INT43_003910 [Umbelopsis isabellina]|uniref:Fe-S cluster assembly protein DRE2 n=1 Tax=Mortierella isabellina TaxID=91625 RepID=A0A8H7PTP0_MORIS|nr:hypothetical protein INT43_003910 [Umbelopsis isabellina]